jgi:hypothetical protein
MPRPRVVAPDADAPGLFTNAAKSPANLSAIERGVGPPSQAVTDQQRSLQSPSHPPSAALSPASTVGGAKAAVVSQRVRTAPRCRGVFYRLLRADRLHVDRDVAVMCRFPLSLASSSTTASRSWMASAPRTSWRRSDSVAIALRPRGCGHLSHQGRPVRHILLIDESRSFAMTSCAFVAA